MNDYEKMLRKCEFKNWVIKTVAQNGCSVHFMRDAPSIDNIFDDLICMIYKNGLLIDSIVIRSEALYISGSAHVEFASAFRKLMSRVNINKIDGYGRCVEYSIKATSVPEIQNVHFNNPVTVVIWADGTKTIVRAQNNEPFDPEKGLTMAITKKALGNKGTYYDTIKKWVEKYEPPLNIDEYCDYNDIRQNVSLNDIYDAVKVEQASKTLEAIKDVNISDIGINGSVVDAARDAGLTAKEAFDALEKAGVRFTLLNKKDE